MTKKSKKPWLLWIADKLLAPTIVGLVLAFAGEMWFQKKLDDVRGELNSTIRIGQNEMIGLINQKVDIHPKQVAVGQRNQQAITTGNNNLTTQITNELKPDFKYDSELSNVVVKRINEGNLIVSALTQCAVKDAVEFDALVNRVEDWHNETAADLRIHISAKAATYYLNTDLNPIPMGGVKSCGQYKRVVQRYLTSLNEIMRGL